MNEKPTSVLDVLARLEKLEGKVQSIEKEGLVVAGMDEYTFEHDPALKNGKGNRESTVKIKFDRKLKLPPKVIAYITALDTDRRWNTRVGVNVKDITNTGATIVVNTWDDKTTSKIYLIKINWVALANVQDLLSN